MCICLHASIFLLKDMLGTIDYIVFGTSLTVFVCIGVGRAVITKCAKELCDEDEDKDYQKKNAEHVGKHKTSRKTRDYLLGAAHHEIASASLSLFASFVSATTLLGLPAATYRSGQLYLIIMFTFVLSASFANFVVVPVMLRHEFKTTLEYLEKRFDKRVFLTAIILYLLSSFLASGLWLGVPVRALSQLSGLGISWTVFITEVVVICYASFGGMKTIVTAHIIQTFVVVISYFTVILKGTVLLGGFDEVFNKNSQVEGRNYFDFDANPLTEKTTSVSLFFGYTVFWSMTYTMNQAVLSRYQPSSNLQKARRIIWLQIPLMMVMYFLCYFLGLVLYAFYRRCDPFLTRRVLTTEQLLPLFVDDIGSHVPGFLGVWITAIYSASLSAIASSLNAISTVVNEHFIQPWMSLKDSGRKNRLETLIAHKPLLLIRVLAIFLSIIMLFFTWIGIALKDSLKARILFANAFSCPSFGLFILGLLNPKSTGKGALIGVFCGIFSGLVVLVSHYLVKRTTTAVGTNVDFCPQFYCHQIGNLLNDSACLEGLESGNFPQIVLPEIPPTSASWTEITSSWTTLFKISPHAGGILSMLITVVVGSLASICFGMTTEDKRKSKKYVSLFLQQRRDKSDENQEKDL